MTINNGLRMVLTHARQLDKVTPIEILTERNLIDHETIVALEDEGYVTTYYKHDTRMIILTSQGYKHFKEVM